MVAEVSKYGRCDGVLHLPFRISTGEPATLQIRDNAATTLPRLLCFPGGGYVRCEMTEMQEFCDLLSEWEIPTVLAPYSVRRPAIRCLLRDATSAIAALVAAGEQGIVQHRPLVLLGFSAGALPALLLGLGADLRVFDLDCTAPAVSGVVNLGGQTDRTSGELRFNRALLGRDCANPASLAAASPRLLLGPKSPPVLSVYGERDQLIDANAIEEFNRVCLRNHVQHETVILPDCGHDVLNPLSARIVAKWCTTQLAGNSHLVLDRRAVR